MNGARPDVTITAGQAVDPDGLEQVRLPLGAAAAAVSKAGTAAYLSSNGSAFTTRTAGFIISESFPRGISSQPGGDLFGVQFSQLPCSDATACALPLGLSGDPGGMAIYKNGIAAGGVGVEADGFYSIDLNIMDFAAPPNLTSDNVTVRGVRLPYLRFPPTPTG